jgi:uncharacterized protein YeaO (DUF488 family)
MTQKNGEFRSKYQKELESKKELFRRIEQIEKEKEIVTLLYS